MACQERGWRSDLERHPHPPQLDAILSDRPRDPDDGVCGDRLGTLPEYGRRDDLAYRGPDHTPIYSLAIDPGPPTTVYAGTGGGVFKSTDGGANWYGVGPSNTPIYSVVIGRPIDDPWTPTTVYAASVEDAGFFFPVSVHKTTDGGLTWSLTGLSSELWQPYSLFLAIDPAKPTMLYATYHGWGCNDDGCFTLGAISKTEDGGDTWGEIHRVIYGGSWVSPLPWPTALAIDPKTSTTLYASWRVLCDPNVQGGIPCQEQNWTNKSTDRGGNWFGISGFSAYTFAIDPQTNPQSDPLPPSIVYAGTDSGVLKSTDGGDTWTSDTTPPDTSITSVTDNNGAALPDQGFTPSTTVTVRFTGTDDRGVARFECQLNGAGFSPCTSPQTYTGLANRQHTF